MIASLLESSLFFGIQPCWAFEAFQESIGGMCVSVRGCLVQVERFLWADYQKGL